MDFMMAALMTQMDELAKKVRELDVRCVKKDRYVPPHERRKSKNKGDGQTEAMLTLLLRKANTQDMVLEKLRENVLLLNQMSTSHVMLIHLLGSQVDKVLNESYKDPKRGCLMKLRQTTLVELEHGDGGIGSTWVQLERVNPSPSPTHTARESEWAKAEVVLNAATRCSRKTELIRGKPKVQSASRQTGQQALFGTPFEPPSFLEPEDYQLLQARRAELHFESTNDPSRNTVPPTRPTPTKTVVQVPPPVQAPPPHSFNRLKAEGHNTILEEKRLSTHGVVDRYPEVWNTIKSTNSRSSQSPEALIFPLGSGSSTLPMGSWYQKGKKKSSTFKPIDDVIVRGRKVKCSNTDINEVLRCTMNVMHYYIDLIQKKTLDDLKGWLAPLVSDVTRRWIEVGALNEKKDLNVAAR
uniref:Integrase core domain containing protein n=1 Tax=Solanum tuberosum TaxID=4113 RepID=M1DZ14_SOLTU